MKAVLYDKMMKSLEKRILFDVRSKLIKKAYGNILEIGAGTGVNFKFYSNQSVTALEPDGAMRVEAQKKIGEKKISIMDGSAEKIPFPDNTYDTVIVTLAFCTIPHPDKALKEIKRVCKPDGKLLIIEHIRNKKRSLALLQDLLTPLWKKFAMGCHLNRDTLSKIQSNDFTRESLDYFIGNNFVVGVFINNK